MNENECRFSYRAGNRHRFARALHAPFLCDRCYAFDEGTAREALEEFITDSSLGSIWLIETDGAPIGYVALTLCYSFEYHGRNAYIDELYIDAAYRGQGIGRQTLRFIEEECRRLRVRAIHLEVERANVIGQALYAKFGFDDHDRYLMTKWVAGE